MATKKINVELRLQKTGSVFSWEVFLEDTNSSSRINSGWDYNIEKGYYYVKLDKYPIEDNTLDVFVGCEGKAGGKIVYTVLIDSIEQTKKVTCKNEDPNYGHESYILN